MKIEYLTLRHIFKYSEDPEQELRDMVNPTEGMKGGKLTINLSVEE